MKRKGSIMNLEYVPLLRIQRELHDIPRGYGRFQEYLRTIAGKTGDGLELPSLVAMNPMGKDHVIALLDDLLALDADTLGALAAAEAARTLAAEPGDFKVGLVIADDLTGGWTNRYASEYSMRFPAGPTAQGKPQLPRWLKHFWITAILWSSEPATKLAVREAILAAVHRTAYRHRHGCARTLRDMLAQEGHVMTMADCTTPVLDADDIACTRELLTAFLDATDMRTAIECLFGDAAGRTLGFTPRGLSPWAGLALALHDARKAPGDINPPPTA
jgi:hypothetical protein